MTAEIAVMNRLAVALATDSAATSVHGGVPKIFNADKLFNLGDCCPVAAMIYEGSAFLGIPWETVIKQFRSTIIEERLWLKDYVDALLAYLTSDDLISDEFVDAYFWSTCEGQVRELLQKSRGRRKEKGGNLSEHCKALAQKLYDGLAHADFLGPMDSGTVDGLRNRYGDELRSFVADRFKGLGTPDTELNELICNALLLFMVKEVEHDFTGVVIAGYGRKELFPGLIELRVEGVVYPRILRFRKRREAGTSLKGRARIVPFAQAEMVSNFMEGVDPTFRDNAFSAVEELLESFAQLAISNCPPSASATEKEIFAKAINDATQVAAVALDQELKDYSRKFHAKPVMDAVGVLPKEQLALMAETLVSLTSFKRRMSSDLETVGGPIDVALISKGDGFVWIKRKHYFDIDLNPRYLRWIQSRLPPRTP
jgi:hypothetical protein